MHQLKNFREPIQKVTNRKEKTQNKPCFTIGLLKSIESGHKPYKKCVELKRQELNIKVKIYKNYIIKLTRQSKANHFHNFF